MESEKEKEMEKRLQWRYNAPVVSNGSIVMARLARTFFSSSLPIRLWAIGVA